MNFRRLVHIVDDEESIRRSVDFLLTNSGYRVERWEDGEKFLKGADKTVPSCVLLDIRMPGIDGLEVQQLMKNSGLDFPIIVLTGHGDVEMAVKAMKAGAIDFLQKPFDRGRLLASIERAFDLLADKKVHKSEADWAETQLRKLTERELEVLDGLACGYPNKTIAFDLGISARTVEVYRANVMSKLAVSNFAEVLRIAFAAGLGSLDEWKTNHSAGGLKTAARCHE